MVSTRKSLPSASSSDGNATADPKVQRFLKSLRIDGTDALKGDTPVRSRVASTAPKTTYHYRGAVYEVTGVEPPEWLNPSVTRVKQESQTHSPQPAAHPQSPNSHYSPAQPDQQRRTHPANTPRSDSRSRKRRFDDTLSQHDIETASSEPRSDSPQHLPLQPSDLTEPPRSRRKLNPTTNSTSAARTSSLLQNHSTSQSTVALTSTPPLTASASRRGAIHPPIQLSEPAIAGTPPPANIGTVIPLQSTSSQDPEALAAWDKAAVAESAYRQPSVEETQAPISQGGLSLNKSATRRATKTIPDSDSIANSRPKRKVNQFVPDPLPTPTGRPKRKVSTFNMSANRDVQRKSRKIQRNNDQPTREDAIEKGFAITPIPQSEIMHNVVRNLKAQIVQVSKLNSTIDERLSQYKFTHLLDKQRIRRTLGSTAQNNVLTSTEYANTNGLSTTDVGNLLSGTQQPTPTPNLNDLVSHSASTNPAPGRVRVARSNSSMVEIAATPSPVPSNGRTAATAPRASPFDKETLARRVASLPKTDGAGNRLRWSVDQAKLRDENRAEGAVLTSRLPDESKSARRRRIKREFNLVRSWERESTE